jgi:hypothetical protein
MLTGVLPSGDTPSDKQAAILRRDHAVCIVVTNFLDRTNLSIVGPAIADTLHLNTLKMGFIFRIRI